MSSVCQFVTASSIREDIVRLLAQQQQPTSKLIERLDACRSGVYKELSNLKQRGALTETEDGWQLTACGQLVTDTIERRQTTEEFLGGDREYWRQHDIGLLPDRFRRRLPEIGEYDIVRGEMPAVDRQVSEFLSRVDAGESPDVLTPIFVRGLEDAIADVSNTRVLVTSEVHDRLVGNEGDEPERDRAFLNANVRIADAGFGLGCTGDSLCLVFPDQMDAEWQATLVSETDAGRQWGEQLFESLWEDADPLGQMDTDSFRPTGRRGMVGKPNIWADSNHPYS
jgi:predicted transcriptional regulator